MRKLALGIAAFMAVSVVGLSGCKNEKTDWQVYMPDGAPALALALPMSQDAEDDGVEYHVVSSTTITTFVTGNSPTADVCVLPVNLAAKLLGNGDAYQMLGIATHGNLYFLSEEDTTYSRENVSLLIGKTVGVVQLNNVPGLTLKAALADLDVPYNDLSGGGATVDNAVNLKAVTPTALTGADVYLLPSPAADLRAANGTMNFVGSLQELYGGENGYPQAAIVAKKSVLEDGREWIAQLLERMDENAAWLQTAEKTVIADAVSSHLTKGLTPTFTAVNLTDGAIAHSGVWLQRMDNDAVLQVKDFLQKIIEIDGQMAAMPSDGFFKAL